MVLILNKEEHPCQSYTEVLDTIRASNRFTCRDTLQEYIAGLKRRIRIYYGDDVKTLGHSGLVCYLVNKGEITVEGI